MAKLCKAKREALRFGTSERLADLVLSTTPRQWQMVHWVARHADFQTLSDIEREIGILRDMLADCPIIVAENVGTYFYDHPQDVWRYRDDFPGVMPPFPRFFVEFARPARVVKGTEVTPAGGEFPARWGWLFEASDAAEFGHQFMTPNRAVDGFEFIHVPDARYFVKAHLIAQMGGKPAFPGFIRWFPVNASGEILLDPPSGIQVPHLSQEETKDIGLSCGCLIFPALLAISFMNCKNVALEAIEPDRAINRERKKHGKRPFVRYHTINIEPMKRVLRTEGQIETQGLKRSLHICRGHFSTYSPERPLFGKVAGTFWVPSHVRGSAKEGVVVSDYAVNAPKATT